MAVLQSVEKIRKRLGYDDIEVVNDGIEAALESATIAIEDAIRTDLLRATVQDIFFIVQSRTYVARSAATRGGYYAGQPRGFATGVTSTTELKLTRGFVDSGETIEVFISDSVRNALGTGDGTRFDLKDPDDYTLLEADKGVLRIQDYEAGNSYVYVTYTAGWLTDGGSPNKIVVPDGQKWLEEAAALKTTLILNGNPVVRKEEMDEAQLKTVQAQLDNILISRSRYAPGSWKPSQTTVTLV